MHHVYAWLRATYRSGGTTAKSAAVRLAMSESPPGGLPYRRELRRSVQTRSGSAVRCGRCSARGTCGCVPGEVDRAEAGPGISARPTAARAACPACGAWSSRVHSGYVRQVEDGPAGGRRVWSRLAIRRFFCGNPACRAATFAEQVDGLACRYQRRTLPLASLMAQIGLALPGRAGARLAAPLGIAMHPATLLRLIAALPDPEIGAAPEVTGVDDFALRKGHV